MANEESLARLDRLFPGEAIGTRVLDALFDPANQQAAALARAGITPEAVEAALAGKPLAGGGFQESPDGGRNFLLEAIVKRTGRPSWLVRHGQVDWTTGAAFASDIKPAIAALQPKFFSVGRVNTINHPSMDWVGTAWLTTDAKGKTIAITNRHVGKEFALLRGNGTVAFKRHPTGMIKLGANVDFRQEDRTPDIFEVIVTAVRYLAQDSQPDICILELEDNPALGGRFEFASAEAAKGQLVATIGYPASDSRNDATAQAEIFGDIFGKKRLAAGFITAAAAPGVLMAHDASTLGGASGSPIIALDGKDAGKVVGLHFSGKYLESNYCVSVTSLGNALRGTVIGGSPIPAGVEGRRDGDHPASHFSGRAGYKPGFLGGDRGKPANGLDAAAVGAGVFDVPLPRPPLPGLASLVGKPGRHELRYTHFSVFYSAARRCPRLTAVNIDGTRAVKIDRGSDKWFADLRIDKALQLTQDDFSGDFDRGHIVRRQDPNWGTRVTAELANLDTFHYTNAALQHALLNRNNTRWLGLEDYILRSTQTHGFRASVFAGPILDDDDPELKDRDDGIQVPLAYWKIVVMPAADGKRLHATGYILGQARFIRTLTESFEFGDFNSFQVPIVAIAGATGIDFGNLHEADPLMRKLREEGVESNAVAVPIEDYEAIVL